MANQVASLRMERKFKKTPAGEIPVDWEAKKLGDLADIRYGLGQPPAADQNGVLMIRATNIKRDRIVENNILRVSRESIPLSRNPFLKEGDIIVVRSGVNTGDVALITKAWAGAVAGYDLVLSPSSEIDATYCMKYLSSERAQAYFASQSGRSAQPHLNAQQLSAMPISLPSLTEQKNISEILSAVDGAIEKTNAVIEKTKESKMGLTQGLLVHGIGHKKFKKTPLGDIPIEWGIEKLGDLCMGTAEYGANVPGREYTEALPRYIRITDIADNGYLIESGPKGISKEDAESYMLCEGDLLFARSGATVGKTYLYQKSDGSCAFAGYLIRFKPTPHKLLPEYLFQVTHSEPYYRWVKGMLRAGAQPNINATEYTDLRLAVPPVNEQKEIIAILSGTDDLILQENKYRERLEYIKKGLLNVLLTGKVRARE